MWTNLWFTQFQGKNSFPPFLLFATFCIFLNCMDCSLDFEWNTLLFQSSWDRGVAQTLELYISRRIGILLFDCSVAPSGRMSAKKHFRSVCSLVVALTMHSKIPSNLVRPTELIKSAEEKVLARFLDRFDVRSFFKKQNSSSEHLNLLLFVRKIWSLTRKTLYILYITGCWLWEFGRIQTVVSGGHNSIGISWRERKRSDSLRDGQKSRQHLEVHHRSQSWWVLF